MRECKMLLRITSQAGAREPGKCYLPLCNKPKPKRCQLECAADAKGVEREYQRYLGRLQTVLTRKSREIDKLVSNRLPFT